MTLNEKLQFYRKRSGFSQEEVAARFNVTRQAVSKWETSGTMPDVETLAKLAKLYDVPPSAFLETESEQVRLSFDSLQWEGCAIYRPFAIEKLKKFVRFCIAAGVLFLALGFWCLWRPSYEWWELRPLWVCGSFAISALCFLAGWGGSLARSGVASLYVELVDYHRDVERRFRLLREQLKERGAL